MARWSGMGGNSQRRPYVYTTLDWRGPRGHQDPTLERALSAATAASWSVLLPHAGMPWSTWAPANAAGLPALISLAADSFFDTGRQPGPMRSLSAAVPRPSALASGGCCSRPSAESSSGRSRTLAGSRRTLCLSYTSSSPRRPAPLPFCWPHHSSSLARLRPVAATALCSVFSASDNLLHAPLSALLPAFTVLLPAYSYH
jgi:hypothetical protein